MFFQYLDLGFRHITDIQGYDHMLFLMALSASFQLKEWKRLLILVTAFTLGHSLTLALAVLNVVKANGVWIEFLIPLTILFTSAVNLVQAKLKVTSRGMILEYIMAMLFGLIHGLGFSNYLRALLSDEFALPLISFNVGIEIGQVLVLAIILSVQFLAYKAVRLDPKHWNIAVSLVAGGISLLLAAQRIPPFQ